MGRIAAAAGRGTDRVGRGSPPHDAGERHRDPRARGPASAAGLARADASPRRGQRRSGEGGGRGACRGGDAARGGRPRWTRPRPGDRGRGRVALRLRELGCDDGRPLGSVERSVAVRGDPCGRHTEAALRGGRVRKGAGRTSRGSRGGGRRSGDPHSLAFPSRALRRASLWTPRGGLDRDALGPARRRRACLLEGSVRTAKRHFLGGGRPRGCSLRWGDRGALRRASGSRSGRGYAASAGAHARDTPRGHRRQARPRPGPHPDRP